MNQDFRQIGFFIETTKDGSPTLRFQHEGESMHHSGGAAAETNYIYGEVISKALKVLNGPSATCVVGLGLGYIEMAWAQALIQQNLKPQNEQTLDTFEIIPELKNNFENWFLNQADTNSIYDLICEKLNSKYSINQVKEILREAFKNQSQFHQDFAQVRPARKWNVICYDAFSQKTNSPLWKKEFLEDFIHHHTEENCVFTTYACTSVLKKVLIEKNFQFIKRPGFFGKRDSTLALRGSFKAAECFSQIS